MMYLIFTIWAFAFLSALAGEAIWTLVLLFAGALFLPLVPAEKN